MAGISGAGRRGDPSRSPERAARARAGSVRDDKVHEAGPGRGGPGPRGGPRQSQETTAAGRRGKLPPGLDRVGRGEYIVRPSLIRLRDQFPFNSNQLRARQLLRRARSLARSVVESQIRIAEDNVPPQIRRPLPPPPRRTSFSDCICDICDAKLHVN